MRPSTPIALLVVLLASACGEASPTQVTVTIRADPGVDMAATRLNVVIRGGTSDATLELVEMLRYGEGSEMTPLEFPVRIAVVPQDGDASRVFEVAATALDATGLELASAIEAGAFESERSLTLDVWLRDTPVGDGGVDGGGMDAGPPMDAGVDGSVPDAAADAATDGGPTDRYNIVFVTSTPYRPGDLGGIAGADAICRMHAMDASLPRPDSYVAFLSTSGEDAVDRLGTSRGWVDVDGNPFVDEIADLAGQQIMYPVRLSETGDPPMQPRVATGTGRNLRASGANCANWSDIDGVLAVRGDSRDGSGRWVDLDFPGTVNCTAELGIYCFGTGIERELIVPAPPSGAALAFVSSGERNGRMGIAELDGLCSDAATAAGLSGTYRALVTPNGSSSAVSRFAYTGPWYRPDGPLVAMTLTDVANERLESAISVTADGFSYGNFAIWVGADTPALSSSSFHCSAWDPLMIAPGSGKIGEAGSTYDFFTGTEVACLGTRTHRVLCLEDR